MVQETCARGNGEGATLKGKEASRKGAAAKLPLWAEYLKAALTGFAAGYALALVLGRSVWLDMRVNIGHAIPVSVASFLLFSGMKKRGAGLAPFLLLQLLSASLLFFTYGFDGATLLIVPAGLFREGFHANALSLPKIDLFLGCFLGAANAVWIAHAATAGRRKNRGSHGAPAPIRPRAEEKPSLPAFLRK